MLLKLVLIVVGCGPTISTNLSNNAATIRALWALILVPIITNIRALWALLIVKLLLIVGPCGPMYSNKFTRLKGPEGPRC